MTNRMDTNPQRVQDRRRALITHFNDEDAGPARLRVWGQGGGDAGGCSGEWVLQTTTCLHLQQF